MMMGFVYVQSGEGFRSRSNIIGCEHPNINESAIDSEWNRLAENALEMKRSKSACNSSDATIRRCKFCISTKPDGAHHCRVCNTCVIDLDHHCSLMGRCISAQQMPAMLTTAMGFLLATCCTALVTILAPISNNILSLTMIMETIIRGIQLIIAMISGYTVILIAYLWIVCMCNNRTTIEYMEKNSEKPTLRKEPARANDTIKEINNVHSLNNMSTRKINWKEEEIEIQIDQERENTEENSKTNIMKNDTKINEIVQQTEIKSGDRGKRSSTEIRKRGMRWRPVAEK
jgi:hypothetical protein